MDNRNVIKHSRKHKDGRTSEMCRSVYDYPRDVSCSSRKKRIETHTIADDK